MFNNQRYSNSISSNFMQKVYGWMAAGLAVTSSVAYYLSPEINPVLFKSLTSNIFMVIGLFFVQFGLLIYMNMRFNSLSYMTMGAIFLAFCALQGISMSPILYIYTGESIAYIFMVACAMFTTMALYGWFTDSDLSSMGSILMMGLFGILIAGIFNIFIQSAAFSTAISVVAVGIFTLLIAYDVQNLKKYSQYGITSPDDMGKFALLGAVSLYLNLINLFIRLLQLFGQKRKN